MLQPSILPSPLGSSIAPLGTDKLLTQSADAIKTQQNQTLTDSGSAISLIKSEQLHKSDPKSKKKPESSRSIFKNLRKVQKSTDNLENYLPVEKSPSILFLSLSLSFSLSLSLFTPPSSLLPLLFSLTSSPSLTIPPLLPFPYYLFSIFLTTGPHTHNTISMP